MVPVSLSSEPNQLTLQSTNLLVVLMVFDSNVHEHRQICYSEEILPSTLRCRARYIVAAQVSILERRTGA